MPDRSGATTRGAAGEEEATPSPRPEVAPREGNGRLVLPPFAALRAFEAVGRLGGIRRAATELSVDHAVVSRHVRALEAWTGLALVDRGRGASQLTEEGAAYHGRVMVALNDLACATSDLMRRTGQARLVIWCVPGFAFRWLSVRLDDFAALHGDIEIELRPTDLGPDFRRNEADGDIRYIRDGVETPPRRDVQMLEFARPGVFPVASPDFIDSMAKLDQPADLLDQPLLHEENEEEWRAWFIAQDVELPARLSGPRLWHAHLTVEAARRGQGIALANPFLLGDDLATGRLQRVTFRQQPMPAAFFGSYAFFARDTQWNAPSTRKFRQWLSHMAKLDQTRTSLLMPYTIDPPMPQSAQRR